jgi:hypothetical protein
MQQSLPLEASDGPILDFIDASVEVGAFEYLWSQPGATFKTLADEVAKTPGARLSHFVQRAHAKELGQEIVSRLKRELKSNFGVCVIFNIRLKCYTIKAIGNWCIPPSWLWLALGSLARRL